MAMIEQGQIMTNFVGQQAQDILLKPIFFDEEIQNIFDVMVMVSSKKKIGFAGALENILKAKTGCGFDPKGSLNLFERTIDTELVAADLQMCFDEFKETIYQESLKKGVAVTDMQGTILGDLLTLRVQQGIRKDILKVAFFGNKASANTDINYVDGMWSVHIPSLVSQGLVPYINSNSGTPLGAGDAIDLLTEVYEQASNVLKATPMMDKIMYVSGDVYLQYQQDLENGFANSTGYSRIEDGVNKLFFRGVEVLPMWEWQKYAFDYLGLADAHLVLYTAKKNMVLATDIANFENQLKQWYDEDSELLKTKSRFRLGFNYKHPEFMAVAY